MLTVIARRDIGPAFFAFHLVPPSMQFLKK
jgi:hypothetical protein